MIKQIEETWKGELSFRSTFWRVKRWFWHLWYPGGFLVPFRGLSPKNTTNKSQIVFGQSDCFRTPFFRCIKQVACLLCLISNFDISSLINKLKSHYFWLIKQEKLLIKQERWHFMFIKHVTFA